MSKIPSSRAQLSPYILIHLDFIDTEPFFDYRGKFQAIECVKQSKPELWLTQNFDPLINIIVDKITSY